MDNKSTWKHTNYFALASVPGESGNGWDLIAGDSVPSVQRPLEVNVIIVSFLKLR